MPWFTALNMFNPCVLFLLFFPIYIYNDDESRDLQETITKLQEKQEEEREAFRNKFLSMQKQSQDTIDHLQKKCQCLTKL